jgi:Activator of Hsp90 ATPase homolog 1-like protein
MTTAVSPAIENLSIDITEEIRVRASLVATFEALLEEMGPSNHGHQGVPMPMKLEPWPGGRWFRDLGDGNGHLWGHVQAIKRPTLLEIAGPLMMSFAVASNVQYRLKEVDGGTLITLRHTALGLFPPDGYRDALGQGWTLIFDRVRRRVESA